jgi:serine protease AprX
MRRVVLAAIITGSLALGVAPSPVVAHPARGARTPAAPAIHGAGLVDLDADGLSDGLERRVRRAGAVSSQRVVVQLGRSVRVADVRRAIGPFRVSRHLGLIDGFAARLSGAQIQALAEVDGLVRAELDARVHATMDANDRDFGTEAARAEFGLDGSGVGLCILDTGLHASHEQFIGRPIDFKDFINAQTNPYDDHGHGTHVASIAAGDGTGGPEAAQYGGVAPAASLIIGKVLNAQGSGTTSQIVSGLQWCANKASVDVISMSLGTSTPSDGADALSVAVDNAVDAGKVAVVAAGNSGDAPSSVGAPGAAAKAITVGAGAEWSAPVGAPNRSKGPYLAWFSSRGPTLDGRTKPDVVGPGVTVTAAKSGTTSGYVTYSGTSMATPFVAGTVVLALQASPGWTPAEVKTHVMETAQDRGAPGVDDDWGAGLLDGYALVGGAAGGTGTTAFPTSVHVDASVADDGTWTYPFSLDGDDLATPIAATIIIGGSCRFPTSFGCLDPEWSPDLDARLVDPSGVTLDESTCIAGAECTLGRQETLHAMPSTAGQYSVVVFPYDGSPNFGEGGSFGMDLSAGAPTIAPPPPPPPPTPTMHVSDLDGASVTVSASKWKATVTIRVHDESEVALAGVVVTGAWGSGSAVSCTTGSAGRCVLSKSFATKKQNAMFTVSSLSVSGRAYVPSANHDPDGDSTGTAIVITRP